MISSGNMHEDLAEVRQHFDAAFEGRTRGTLLSDICAYGVPDVVKSRDASASPLDRELVSLLQPGSRDGAASSLRNRTIIPTFPSQRLNLHGVTYTTWSENPKDSRVIFGRDKRQAGIIENIFTISVEIGGGFKKSGTFLAVKTFRELSSTDAALDVYRRFPVAGGRIVYKSVSRARTLIPAEDLVSHFASTPDVMNSIIKPHMHVLPLDRVSELTLIVINSPKSFDRRTDAHSSYVFYCATI